MDYHPRTIYTTLNDVFEESGHIADNEGFQIGNYARPKLMGKEVEKNRKKNKKLITSQKVIKEDKFQNNKYVNKDLVKSWIHAVQLSK